MTKRMSKSMVVLVASMALGPWAAQAAASSIHTYDYSTVPTATGFPGTTLGGQDNWVAISPGTTVRNDLDFAPGMSGNNAYHSAADSQSSRLNDANFSYNLVGDHLTLEYTGRINGSAKTAFALGTDTGGNGQIDGEGAADEVGFQFGIQGNKWYVRRADFGDYVYSQPLGLPGNGHTWRLVLQADLAANGGDGSGSMFVQQLGDIGNNPVTYPLMPVPALQDVNLGMLDLAGAAGDPANWDGLYTRIGASNMEDLTVVTDQPAPTIKTVVYTFDGLVGGVWPGTELTDGVSQDGWTNAGGAGLHVTTGSNVYSSGEQAYRSANGDGQAVRADTLSDVEDIVELSFMLRGRNPTGYMMALGLRDSATDETTFQFGFQNNNWFIRESDFGAQHNTPAGLTAATEGYLAVLQIDTSANGGNGSGSLLVQNLSTGPGGPLTPVAGLQNVDLKLLSMDLGSADPSEWDALYIRMAGGGATMDNLMVQFTPVPEPTTVMLAILGAGCLLVFGRRRR